MEFERLSRRDLQGLCKKNKIPANITNVAMIDALKALDIIEGIEELMLQPCESETAQSSIDSPEKMEVTSPCVPPTGGRTTRRRNVKKEEPETVQPLTRTLRSTRKTVVKDAGESKADGTETPALMQTTRRRAPAASVCRKMDSQLKECVEEEKKSVSVTPAPSAVTSRRRRGVKEESVVTKVYSTRRSVRLAGYEEISHVVGSEKSETLKNENMQMNLKEDFDDMDETSGITGADVNTNVEQIGGKDESEVTSAQEHEIAIGEESAQVSIDEEMANNFEVDGQKPEEDVENEKADFGFETNAKVEEEKACDSDENVVIETEDKYAVDFPRDTEMLNEIEKEMDNDVLDLNMNEKDLEINADPIVSMEEKELIDDTYEVADDSTANLPSDITLMNEEDEAKIEPNLLAPLDPTAILPEHIPTNQIIKPTSLTPAKSTANKASATKNIMVVVSDNKENIGSGSKLVLTKDTVKIKKKSSENATNFDGLSVRQLTKMLKEKLEITKKFTKNENENENENEAPVRLALQALPENRAVGGTHNLKAFLVEL